MEQLEPRLPTTAMLGGQATIDAGNRELLAMMLLSIGVLDHRVDPAKRRENIHWAIALASTLGYPTGIDRHGYARINLPSGHVSFYLGFVDCIPDRWPDSEATNRKPIENYYDVAIATRNPFAGGSSQVVSSRQEPDAIPTTEDP